MDKIITRAWTFNIIETIQHDLVHDKTAKKKARVEARFGALEHDLMQADARQAGKKKKHALEQDLVHDKPRKKTAI
jgi:anti-sigma factor ChrR (cupin superfamily)